MIFEFVSFFFFRVVCGCVIVTVEQGVGREMDDMGQKKNDVN